MLRITKRADGARMEIVVDGQFGGEGVEIVESICERERISGNGVDLVLRDLTGIDRKGVASLKRLFCKGVRVQASGVYDSYVVQALRETAASGKSARD